MPRALKSAGKTRHDPLHVQLDDDELHAKYGRVTNPGKRRKARKSSDDEENGEVILDPKTSQKIFELARVQQEELEMPEDEDDENDHADFSQPREYNLQTLDGEDDEDSVLDDNADADADAEEALQIDSSDLNTLDALLPANSVQRRTLADIIFAKLEGTESSNPAVIQNVHQDQDAPDPALGLNPKVVEAYTKLGFFLQKYTSGSLPKLFKVIPTLPAWARMLALTQPENWSPHACRAATRIFISTMKPTQAQIFLEVVLLDAIRGDIQQNKKLNVHYYEALRRALYKPSAFFKGIIFSMLDTGCTLKEAAIVASILAKTKVPVLHSSAALIRIASMDYAGPNSLFIRVLLDKKYDLPYKVLDTLVFHFIRLSNTYKSKGRGDSPKLPVLWHQSLLVFCQRYAPDLTPDQKDALLDVVRVNPHPQISSEVRRELVSSVARGEAQPGTDGDVDMS